MAQELHDSRPWGDFIRRGLEIWWCSAPNEDDPPALEARRRIIRRSLDMWNEANKGKAFVDRTETNKFLEIDGWSMSLKQFDQSRQVQTQSSLRPVFEMPDYWLEEDWTPERIRQGWRKFQEK
ncbi:unnamed protein product [Oikopleura dioica]|uniref:Uncharacterized protein n=1 Tax=Oikopleura dioica TaxID=34765 RepID=E4XFD6_OIKDI|nr:unnamed protein product [Oikopleura dioica]